MSRTDYHRAYYWARLDARRASARASRRKAREWQAVIRIVCEAVTEARNDKPPTKGVDAGGGMALSSECGSRYRQDKPGETVCQLPTSDARLIALVGETTRRANLNPHRGSHIVDALRKRRGANGS